MDYWQSNKAPTYHLNIKDPVGQIMKDHTNDSSELKESYVQCRAVRIAVYIYIYIKKTHSKPLSLSQQKSNSILAWLLFKMNIIMIEPARCWCR